MTRYPNRIDPLLQALGELWRRYPDLRFGQMVVCAADVGGADLPQCLSSVPEWNRLFVIEDDALLRGIETMLSYPVQK